MEITVPGVVVAMEIDVVAVVTVPEVQIVRTTAVATVTDQPAPKKAKFTFGQIHGLGSWEHTSHQSHIYVPWSKFTLL